MDSGQSLHFEQEPESTLRSVQEPIKIFSEMILVVVKQKWNELIRVF